VRGVPRPSPDLVSERLAFYRPTANDFEESAALWGDSETVRYIGGTISSREESWARLLRNIGHWHVTGFGFWVVRDLDSGCFAGEVGAKLFRRSLDAAWEDMPEIGWVLARWAHGRGLATEATRAALKWGEERFGWDKTLCLIDPANAASHGVATKCGFLEIARREYKNDEVIVYRRRCRE
jgi:RimJ/RimL family protein N-acetyltransferase